MDKKNIAVMGLLILIGLGLALTVVFIVGGETGRTEDLWLVQDPLAASTPGSVLENGTNIISGTVPGNDTSPQPVETTDFTNASVRTGKMIAYNQSAVLVSFPSGKLGLLEIADNEDVPEEAKIFSTEQRKQAEKIALSDARVQDIIGAGMYTEDIQLLDTIRVNDSRGSFTKGTYASITFTMVNTTTAKNETAFFVHVDLDNNKVIRVSPPFPQERVTPGT
ncbi:MAG: hypothetical protein WC342_05265 [Methanoregula sp.]